jgi:hypothetical protein
MDMPAAQGLLVRPLLALEPTGTAKKLTAPVEMRGRR